MAPPKKYPAGTLCAVCKTRPAKVRNCCERCIQTFYRAKKAGLKTDNFEVGQQPSPDLITRLPDAESLYHTLLAAQLQFITPMPEGRFMEVFKKGDEVWFRYTFKLTPDNNPFAEVPDENTTDRKEDL